MSNAENPSGFVQKKLPWIVGAGALVVFLLTLNHWVNLRSLGLTSRISGWELDLPVQWPLFFTITYPFRFLPVGIQPVALNLFAVLCAVLSVVLLARSVALLPHDRTHEQRIRERSDFSLLSIPLAWVPVVLASVALAFQLTFWENATSITGEMIDVLCFAYVIRCLLEFRISQDDRWLSKMALVYGLAVTNNWAMIGFFPLFLGAVIWIKGIRFFDPGFLGRMLLFGLAGLLLYVVLPTLWVMKGGGEFSFFEVLRGNWVMQKMPLVAKEIRNRALLLALTSVLPVVLMGIRWRTSEGDTNAAGSFLTNMAFRVIHLFFLAACLWIVFDPKYSPRSLGMGMSFLTFYYLGALVIGYYSGYALLVFSGPPRKSRFRESTFGKLFNPLVKIAVLAALVGVPAGLIYKNFARVRSDNGVVLRNFARQLSASLPPAPAYLLADDAYALALMQAHLADAKSGGYVFAHTTSLEIPSYHEKLRRRYGDRWPSIGSKDEIGARVAQPDIQTMVKNLASSNVVAYLHPSFGYFFEALYLRPNGQAYRLQPYQPSEYLPPGLSTESLAANEDYWKKTSEIARGVLALREQKSIDAAYVARYYSRGMNAWGVELQREGRLADAGRYFDQAYDLNTNNVPARANRDFNKVLQAGSSTLPPTGKTLEERFGEYRSWDQVLKDNGPFDHPEFCELLGSSLLSQGQFRQAALQFSSVIKFQPKSFFARVGFARCLIGGFWLTEAIAEVDRIVADFPELADAEKVDVANLRASIHFNRRDYAQAEATLKQAKQALPEHSALAESLFELYRVTGNYTNAMGIINEQLGKTPTNIVIHLQKAELQLANKDFPSAHQTLDRVITLAPKNVSAQLFHAFAYIQEAEYDKALTTLNRILAEDSDNVQAQLYRGIAQLEKKNYDEALEAFDSVLALQPENQAALRNRAILHLRAQRWGEAKDDYELLRKLTPKSHAVLYGLAEIAFHENKHADATRYYDAYLKYAPADGGAELDEEKKKVQERLKQLQNPGK